MYYYTTFGLHIRSEIELPELGEPGREENPDLTISFKAIPDEIPDALYRGKNFKISPSQVLIRIEQVAQYLVRKGREIDIAPCSSVEMALVRVFLLGPVIGIALHQIGFLVLHGSSVRWNNQAIIFSGASGSGKSTIAGALISRGSPFLADDLCPLRMGNTGIPLLFPSIPQLKLMEDALPELDFSLTSAVRLSSITDKYGISFAEKIPSEPLPVRLVFILQSEPAEKDIRIEPLSGIEKFHALKDNTYRFPLLHYMNLSKKHFDLATSLAKQVAVYRIIRNTGIPIETMADALTTFLSRL